MGANREVVLADLAAARAEFCQALEGLSDDDMESPLGPEQWRIRDMLVHVTHWNRWGMNRLRWMAKHGAGMVGLSPIDADGVNERIAAAWSLHPLRDVLSDFESCYEDLLACIRALPEEWAEGEWEYGGRPTNPKHWFSYTAQHERDHAAEVREWRERR